MSINKSYRDSGMKRMLQYQKCIYGTEMTAICERCEEFCGTEHDYNECTGCPAFQMYCELEEFRFANSFREDMGR